MPEPIRTAGLSAITTPRSFALTGSVMNAIQNTTAPNGKNEAQMKFCEYMNMIEGGQYCKVPGLQCPYQGRKVMMEFMGFQNTVTICDLNSTQNLLALDLLLESCLDERTEKNL